MPQQGLHRDDGPWCPRPEVNPHAVMPMVAQAMVALSDFTLENGATRLVGGSHLTGVDGAAVPPDQESRLVCKAGTLLVYDSIRWKPSSYFKENVKNWPRLLQLC
jgi:ectoine hydroxylase-related dioxygenase (phytanoyl-CoA dioxygenase family)